MLEYDVVIVGGGLVGGSLGCALRGSGLRVLVVEAAPAGIPDHPSYDERSIALSLGSRRVFDGIGIWPHMAADAEPIRHVHVSDRGHFGFVHLDAEDEGVEALGYVTPARAIGRGIEAGLADAETVEFLRPARLVGLSATAESWQLEVAVAGRSRLLQARLIVGADGGDSTVRRRLGLGVRARGYGYDAIISTITPERPQPGTAFERFTDSGPLAMLPMTGDRYSVVWTARDRDTANILGLDDDRFTAALQQRFGQRLGRLGRPGRRIAYPLRLALAKQLTRPRLVLIGNAAHTLHPVAGQGFNLGLRDVAELAELLGQTEHAGQDPGGDLVVTGYRKRRRTDQWRAAVLTDGLARLFVNPWTPVRLSRNLGMLGLNLCAPARHRLAQHFMGTGGHLSRLERGLPIT